MLYDAEAERDIYLIFQDDQSYLCSSLFKEGFKHAFAIERMGLGWVCFDPSRRDLVATILPATYSDNVMEPFLDQNPTSTVMRLIVRRAETTGHTYPRLGLISCVSMVQYLLGVYWPLTITPYQLYYRLATTRTPHIEVKDIWQAVRKHERQQMPQLKPLAMKQKHSESKPNT